jgi:6-phosphogluconolactonase (cycloisomerase 2 family)
MKGRLNEQPYPSALQERNFSLSKLGRPLAAYASVGPRLIRYDLDAENAVLVERQSIDLPENIHYAWPHASGDCLYVASSNGGPNGTGNNRHCAVALRIDPVSGELRSLGEPQPLASRPVHITVDAVSRHLLIAYNNPSGLTVHRLNQNGSLGEVVQQSDPLEFGIFAHQVRVNPTNTSAILVTRGNDAAGNKPEDPGALKVFGYSDGTLTAKSSIAPGGGYGFGPRNLDFHPSKPWLFVALERQNRLCVFASDADGVAASPLFERGTLDEPRNVRPRQMAGEIHCHPNGHVVYVANRALGTTEFEGRSVSAGGETTIVTFAIDGQTGEPTKVQSVDSGGGHPRTFAVDPTGRLLIAANSTPLVSRDGISVPANLALFHIEADGTLRFLKKYEFPDEGREIFWMGMA